MAVLSISIQVDHIEKTAIEFGSALNHTICCSFYNTQRVFLDVWSGR